MGETLFEERGWGEEGVGGRGGEGEEVSRGMNEVKETNAQPQTHLRPHVDAVPVCLNGVLLPSTLVSVLELCDTCELEGAKAPVVCPKLLLVDEERVLGPPQLVPQVIADAPWIHARLLCRVLHFGKVCACK